MTGRGIDQILPYPSNPRLYEPYMDSAVGYVMLAEKVTGELPRAVDFTYVWGEALNELEQLTPDARIINLETSITTSEDWCAKGINYRMHPKNVPCIMAAKIDCCVLANNHVLDWGYAGLAETLETLQKVNVRTVGAGYNRKAAQAPAVIDVVGKGRVIVFSWGATTSGIPRDWAALENRAGVNLLEDLSEKTLSGVAVRVRQVKRPGDLVVVSIHWGGNWGYTIPPEQINFAHRLIDQAGVNIVYGHSSHHAKGIEVYRGSLILYGCGDFLNDYEGISSYERFRGDLVLMYFAAVDAVTGKLHDLIMTPLQIKYFKLNPAKSADVQWLSATLTREGQPFGTRVELMGNKRLVLRWE